MPIRNIKVLRLFLQKRYEDSVRLDYISNCLGVLAKGQNFGEDFPIYTEMVRNQKLEEKGEQNGEQVKNRILGLLEERG